MNVQAEMSSKQSFRFRLGRFNKSTLVMDLRDPLETRKKRAEKAERKNKTYGKKSRFTVYD